MRIVGPLIVLAVALGACQTALLDPQGLLDTQGKTKAGPASVAEIIADMHDVSPRNAVRALRKRGFKPYSDKGLKGKMAGKTLQIAATYGFYGKDGTVRVRDTGGGGPAATGTWTVRNAALCYATTPGVETCNGLYFRGRDVLCWPRIGGEAPDTGYLSECRIFKGDVTERLPIEGVVSLLVNVPAADGVGAIAEQGFAVLTNQELWRRVAGNTLRLAGSFVYFSDDRSVELASTALGSGLTSSGTWKIKKRNVCHSIRDGQEFCTGLYFRGEEILCWPGIGRYARDTGYLRACAILRGNRVASAPIGTVLAAMEMVPAKDAPRAMEKHGFVQLSGNEIWRRIAGKTLRMSGSYGRFAKDKTVTIESTALGSGLTSSGTWKIKKRNVCHSIRDGQEFCTGLYFRGEEILCWPGIGRYARDTGYLRECDIFSGQEPPSREAPPHK